MVVDRVIAREVERRADGTLRFSGSSACDWPTLLRLLDADRVEFVTEVTGYAPLVACVDIVSEHKRWGTLHSRWFVTDEVAATVDRPGRVQPRTAIRHSA